MVRLIAFPHPIRFVAVVFMVIFGLTLQRTQAQFYNFTRAIPVHDTNGAVIANGNTTFADGSFFQPAGNDSRSTNWAWRPYGDTAVLSALGLSTSTPPTNTKELVTTVCGLKPGTNYVVAVLFWSSSSWGVRAGLNYASGTHTNTWFDTNSSSVIDAELLPWDTNMPSLYYESGRTLYAGPLGNAVANPNGQLKVFVHDFPTGDSNQRTWYQGVAVAPVISPSPQIINATNAGTPFHRGVRGCALTDPQVDWGEFVNGIPKSVEAARGSSIRGVSTGLAAERYDWRTRNGQPRLTTLDTLRYSRDSGSELFLGVNMRGLIQPNPAGGWLYYDTQTNTLASLAADWVRYVNHIVPTYRQGDGITDTRDATILNSITWNSSYPGDSFDILLAPGEAAVPQIKYWEIGNEPTVGVTSYSVSNSFTLDPTNYHARYAAIVQAIKAENPTVKVGPTIINGTRERDQLAALVSDPSLPIDFITYHPYEKMGLLTDPREITLHLGSIYSRQLKFYLDLKQVVATNGRDPETIEYAATEVNVSNWDTNDTDKEARMAHALGTVETVFTHARLGLVASHYWVYPTHRYYGTEYPVFKAYEKLRDHMGDTLLSAYACGDVRVYTTRDSKTGELAVWMLNFSNDQTNSIDLKLQNLPAIQQATLLRLQAISGATTLFSSNLAPDMAGGPTLDVDWASSDLSSQDFSAVHLNLPSATLSVLVIQPGVECLTPTFRDENGEKWFSVSFRRLPYASGVRYRLLRTLDLRAWDVVSETGSGLPAETTLSDNQPISQSSRQFYRVDLIQE